MNRFSQRDDITDRIIFVVSKVVKSIGSIQLILKNDFDAQCIVAYIIISGNTALLKFNIDLT